MQAVMISIHPKWCGLIASGKKTIEVRKTRPKIDPPFKVYMYETKGQFIKSQNGACTKYGYGRGKVIGEFVCDEIIEYSYDYCDGTDIDDDSLLETQLEREDINIYAKGKTTYGWHISDLVIYDEPKKLESFKAPCLQIKPCEACRYSVNDDLPFAEVSVGCDRTIRRPPQSWCYAEEL